MVADSGSVFKGMESYEAGRYAEAITLMYKAFQANPQDPSTSESFVSLLDEAGLTQGARQEEQRFNRK